MITFMSSKRSSKRSVKTAPIGTKVPKVVKDALDYMAYKDGMSRASFIEYLIRREAERRQVVIQVEDEDDPEPRKAA
jgi:hypothetical protein